MAENDEQRRREAHAMFKSLPGYPFLPCPICGGTAGCDDTVLERAQAAHPGLVLDPGTASERPVCKCRHYGLNCLGCLPGEVCLNLHQVAPAN